MGGRETQEGRDMGIYVYVQLIHFVIKQKLTHKKKKKENKNTICDIAEKNKLIK